MNPFDQAWALLKMPVYETGIPGIRFVTQGEDEPDWNKDPTVFGQNMVAINHTPEAVTDKTPYSQIRYMTPAEFLSITPKEEMDDSSEYYRNLFERAHAGEDVKFTMPEVISMDLPGLEADGVNWVPHNGRHRMQELVRMGLGDVPVPVHYTDLG